MLLECELIIINIFFQFTVVGQLTETSVSQNVPIQKLIIDHILGNIPDTDF